MAQAIVAIKDAATLLNDAGMTNFDFTALMKFMPKAHRDLQLELLQNGLPIVRNQTAILTVDAGALNLGTDLPTNLIEPIEMHERAFGSSDLFKEMFQREWEPDVQQSDSLIYWIWREEVISFLGATSKREVRLRYSGGLTIPVKEADSIGVTLGESYLGPRIAALAAYSIGGKQTASDWNKDATICLDKIINMSVRQQQALPARRRGFKSNKRRRIWV